MPDIIAPENKIDTPKPKKSTTDLLSSSRSKFVAQRKRKRKVWAIILVVLFLGLCVGIVYLLRLGKVRVHAVIVSETKVIDAYAVQDAVRTHISGYYAWVIPKDSIFLLPLPKIRSDIVKTFPYAKTVNVRRVGLDTVAVDLTERKGVYLWCVDETNASCYFMDDDGYVFSVAPYFSGNVYIRFYGDRPMAQNGTGNFATVEKMQSINKIITYLDTRKLETLSFNLKSNQTILKIESNNHPIDVVMLPEFDAAGVDQTIGTLLANESFAKNIEKLRTLDLRFGNKIFYTFADKKTQEPIIVPSETVTNPTTQTMPENTTPEIDTTNDGTAGN